VKESVEIVRRRLALNPKRADIDSGEMLRNFSRAALHLSNQMRRLLSLKVSLDMPEDEQAQEVYIARLGHVLLACGGQSVLEQLELDVQGCSADMELALAETLRNTRIYSLEHFYSDTLSHFILREFLSNHRCQIRRLVALGSCQMVHGRRRRLDCPLEGIHFPGMSSVICASECSLALVPGNGVACAHIFDTNRFLRSSTFFLSICNALHQSTQNITTLKINFLSTQMDILSLVQFAAPLVVNLTLLEVPGNKPRNRPFSLRRPWKNAKLWADQLQKLTQLSSFTLRTSEFTFPRKCSLPRAWIPVTRAYHCAIEFICIWRVRSRTGADTKYYWVLDKHDNFEHSVLECPFGE